MDLLIIEDCHADYEAFEQAVKTIPIVNKLYHANTLKEADVYLNQPNLNIGLIVLDFYIGGNGLTTYTDESKTVVELAKRKNIPILFLSEICSKDLSIEGYKRGAVAFLEKPINLGQFLSVVKAIEGIGIKLIKV